MKADYSEHRIRLAVFGSRALAGRAVRNLIRAVVAEHSVTDIVTAAEPVGVSLEARQVAKEDCIPLTLHALNRRHARGGHHHRGQAIVDDTHLALAIHDGESKGTMNELDQAKQAGQHTIYKPFYPRGIAFVAYPYDHPDDRTRQEHDDIAAAYITAKIANGEMVYSPAMRTTPTGTPIEYLRDHDAAMAAKLPDFILLTLRGWENSTAVATALGNYEAHHRSRPIRQGNPRQRKHPKPLPLQLPHAAPAKLQAADTKALRPPVSLGTFNGLDTPNPNAPTTKRKGTH